MLAAGLIDQTAIVIGARIGRIQLDGPLEIAECLFRAAIAPQEAAPPDIGGVIGGIDPQGLLVIGQRLAGFAEGTPDQRAVAICLVEARIELYCAVEIAERLAILAAAPERGSPN